MNEKFLKLYKMVLNYNLHTNLTRIVDKKEFKARHIDECYIPLKNIIKPNTSILDVGTGAGFPGLVLAIVFTNVNITMIESNRKKAQFVQSVINELKLKNAKVINKRAEQDVEREKYDYVVARAVGSLNVVLELIVPYLKVGGSAIFWKGPNYKKEINELNSGHELLGLQKEIKISNYAIVGGIKTYLLFFNKTKKTPIIYPRQYSTIKLKPIKK